MFKILVVFVLFGAVHAQAVSLTKKISAEIMGAAYVDIQGSQTVEVAAKYKGGCGAEKAKLNVKSCVYTGSLKYSCIADFEVHSNVNQSCIDRNVERVFVMPRDHIKIHEESLSARKFNDASMVIRGKNSEAKIQLKRM